MTTIANQLRSSITLRLVVLGLLVLCHVSSARADDPHPDGEILETARFDQRLNSQIPLSLGFRNEQGSAVRLDELLSTRPVILVLAYYQCPNLCNTMLEDLVENLNEISLTAGQEFDVVTVSIDPRETPGIASEAKASLLRHYNRGTEAGKAGWHALTGNLNTIERLAAAVGFRYAYDTRLKQYAHPSGLVVLTPQGRISRYFYGLVYSPTDLRLGLVEASANKIGSPVDEVLLRCYSYDPETGKYTLAIMDIVRGVGLITFSILGAFLVVNFRRDRRFRL